MNQLQRVAHPDPHRAGARRLLRAHPEIRALFGPSWWTPPLAVALVALHVGVAWWVASQPMWVAVPTAFVVGAFLSQALYAVLHECAHLLAGRGRALNRVVSLVTNLPLLVPMAVSYPHYHLMHHRHAGELGRDPDLPVAEEHALARRGAWGKLAWHATFPFWQLWRTRTLPKPQAKHWLAANVAVQLAFTALIAWHLGTTAVVYLALSLWFTMSLHPTSARLFQEHHVVRAGQETYSYYGPLNAICLNVGYHHEHHDFPAVPWSRLPRLRRTAASFYDHELTSHRSWWSLWIRFFRDDSLGPLSRVVRGPQTQTPHESVIDRAGSTSTSPT